MEYNDGSDVEPGHDLTDGSQSFGPASYDSDHDGVADSVIVGVDDHTVMFTDSDGDGEIDSRTVYDAEGNLIQHQDASGHDDTTSSSSDSSGSDTTGSDTTGSDTTGSDTTGSDSHTNDSHGSDTSGSDTSGSDTTGSDSHTNDSHGSDTSDSSGTDSGDHSTITVTDDHGRSVEVGPPTVDMNGDGTPDTAVVQGKDGSTLGYTDRNGDGQADQITEITADRHVTISVLEADGSWSVAQTGTLDDNGHFTPDEGTADTQDVRYDVSGEGAALGLVGGIDTPAAAAPGVENVDTVEPAVVAVGGPVAIVYTDPEGNTYELGMPTEDFNGDGHPDTVVTTLADGTIVGYSDVDGDGLTDQVTQINTDGTVTIGVPDGDGGWEEAASGTLGENGEFVPAETVSA